MAPEIAMAPRRAMYLYAATIAVADGEASLLRPLDPASIGNGRCFGKRLSSRMLPQCPSKPPIGATYQKRLGLIFQSAWGA